MVWEVWNWVEKRLPKFLYFDEYDLLPSKTNLPDLAARVAEPDAKGHKQPLEPKHRAVLALLRMADVAIEDFAKPGGYEPLKAKIEAVSMNLTDQIMEFWKQNEWLEVEVDINTDEEDSAPFNSGPNLYLRIRNRRNRGVSTPFHQRSRGFIWFFSFLVWFDSVCEQFDEAGELELRKIILLLDEPGLSLHALAQADFLKYIDSLAGRHQVLYTTHSPFMIHSDRLHQIRIVEDRDKEGTVITKVGEGEADARTLFPLQAALGWTIAQNLFISEKNLLVEGPSELLYLQALSAILEAEGREDLREDVTIVPTGGLDKVSTFVALLGANGLKLVVLHDYKGSPDQKLHQLVREKMIPMKAVLDVSQFRDLSALGKSGKASDVEDLLPPGLYIEYFNKAFAAVMAAPLKESDLPPGDRIVERIERHLEAKAVKLRPSGGFNHYRVASEFSKSPPTALDAETLARFEALFKRVNSLYPAATKVSELASA